MIDLKKYEKEFQYLEAVRVSGITNMYGAGPYLQSKFNINKNKASEILSLWMDFYDSLCDEYGWQ